MLEDETTVLGKLTYDELAKASRAVAAGLIKRDVMPGDRVALMLPTGIDFFLAFFGILYEAIPVPIYPPMQRSQIEDFARKQAGILRNAGALMLVTVPEGLRLGSLLQVWSRPSFQSKALRPFQTAPMKSRRPLCNRTLQRPSFNTRRVVPEILRGSSSATQTCLRIFGQSVQPLRRTPPTCS